MRDDNGVSEIRVQLSLPWRLLPDFLCLCRGRDNLLSLAGSSSSSSSQLREARQREKERAGLADEYIDYFVQCEPSTGGTPPRAHRPVPT